MTEREHDREAAEHPEGVDETAPEELNDDGAGATFSEDKNTFEPEEAEDAEDA